jgi:hypothetical protein
MKTRLGAGGFYASTFVLSLAALVGIGPQASSLVQASETQPDSVFSFSSTREGGKVRLQYRFKGLHDQWHEVICRISEAESRPLSARFGYLDKESATDGQKIKVIGDKAREEGALDEYGDLSIQSGYLYWLPSGSLQALPDPARTTIHKAARQRFYSWYEPRSNELGRLIAESFRKSRGFVTDRSTGELMPDYPAVVQESAKPLRDCASELNRVTSGEPSLLALFFQSMPHSGKRLENREGRTGKMTGGLMLPAAVMTEGVGDCDSKATAFCTIQRGTKRHRLVLLRSIAGPRSPSHAHLGVEAWKEEGPARKETWWSRRVPEALKAMVYGKPIRIGLRDYWPCEVVGPGRTAFGEVPSGHEGYYIAIRIPSAG